MAALDALGRRDHHSRDLERRLVEKGYDPAVAITVIERLLVDKLVNDQRYVENFVSYHAGRGQGPLRVRAELRQLGIAGDIVEECLRAYPNWLIQLRKTQQKKFGAAAPSHFADKQRQMRFLSYRGFTGAQIRMALGFDTDIDLNTEDL